MKEEQDNIQATMSHLHELVTEHYNISATESNSAMIDDMEKITLCSPGNSP